MPPQFRVCDLAAVSWLIRLKFLEGYAPHRTGLPPTVDAFSIRTVGNVVMLFIIDSVLHRLRLRTSRVVLLPGTAACG